MKHSLTLAIILSALAFQAPAQQTTKLSATKSNDYGIVYSLPQTALTVSLTAEGTVKTPGEFYQYAERYLGPQAARQAISKPSSDWVLTSAKISVKGVPQTSGDTYLMQFKSGSSVFLMVNSQGLPLALGTEVDEPAEAEEKSGTQNHHVNTMEGTAARYAMTEEMIQSSSVAKRASLAAAQIMELRQSRQDYLTGQADQMPDGAALKIILDNINAQEEALTAMFLGTTQTRTAETTVDFVPGDASLKDVVISRLSPLNGFVDADDLSGNPIYLSLSITDRGQLPLTEKGEQKKAPKNGITYCIPGSATASIDFGGKQFCTKSFPLAQAGVVYGLDPSLFTDKKAPAYVIFDTTTGGIRELGTK